MLVLCCDTKSAISLDDISNLSQVFIALANLFLAGYILFYQIKKDKKTESDTAKLNEQNIKLQWFKELIVQPNMPAIILFYNNLTSIESRITTNDLSVEQKEDINNFVKNELTILRKSFVDVLLLVDKKFANELLVNLDELIDGITNSIFDDELKLTLPAVYEKKIGSKISYSKNNLVAQLYNYKGLSNL